MRKKTLFDYCWNVLCPLQIIAFIIWFIVEFVIFEIMYTIPWTYYFLPSCVAIILYGVIRFITFLCNLLIKKRF